MDYQWAAWCITVAIGYVFGQVLLRQPELLRALQTIGVIYIKLYHFRSFEGRPTAQKLARPALMAFCAGSTVCCSALQEVWLRC
jgi:hypothetical protein